MRVILTFGQYLEHIPTTFPFRTNGSSCHFPCRVSQSLRYPCKVVASLHLDGQRRLRFAGQLLPNLPTTLSGLAFVGTIIAPHVRLLQPSVFYRASGVTSRRTSLHLMK